MGPNYEVAAIYNSPALIVGQCILVGPCHRKYYSQEILQHCRQQQIFCSSPRNFAVLLFCWQRPCETRETGRDQDGRLADPGRLIERHSLAEDRDIGET